MPTKSTAAGYPCTELDGVRVIFADVPGPLTAGLVFGVGQAHETLKAHGMTHLVEHLALSGRPEGPHAFNGSTGLATTTFVASGAHRDVVEHLGNVCRSLAAPPTNRLEHERTVIRSEAAARAAAPASDALAIWRFGARGFGLPAYEEFALRWAQADDVTEHAARFAADSAVLWLSAPPPAGLGLPLPAKAPRPPEPPLVGPDTATPGSFRFSGGAVVFSMLLPRSPDASCAMWLLHDRLHQRLRNDLGLSYGPDGSTEALTASTRLGLWSVPCLPENAAEATRAVCEVLASLRSAPADGSEWERLRSDIAMGRTQRTPADVIDDLDGVARLLAQGGEADSREDFDEKTDQVSPDDVTSLWSAALPTLVIGSPALEAIPDSIAEPMPHWSQDEVTGRRFRASPRNPDPRAKTLVVADEGLTILGARPGERLTVRYASTAVALTYDDGAVVLIGEDGHSLDVAPEHWKAGRTATAAIGAHLPQAVAVPAGTRTPSPKPRRARTSPSVAAWLTLALSWLPLTGVVICLTFLAEYRSELRELPARVRRVYGLAVAVSLVSALTGGPWLLSR